MDLEQKAERLIKEYNMIDSGDNILVAFSGGSDSSAMLFFLTKYLDQKNMIYAAHMNHMIRNPDAYNDEKFAVETCLKYNVKIFTECRNIPEIAKISKKTIEEAARDERYDFLKKTAGMIGGNVKIVTAHTASDNTETVIFNLSRGCGLSGLSGIAPVNQNKNMNINIVRPFLSCSKHDILQYCETNHISYVEDATNFDENYTRNFIRHSIASKLKEKFGSVDENIFKTTEIMRDTVDFLNCCVDDITKNYANQSDGSNGIDVDFLLTRHKTLQRAVISKLYENAVAPDIKKLEYKHILYVEELLKTSKISGNFDQSIDLPGLVTARVSKNKLIFKKIENKKTSRNRR